MFECHGRCVKGTKHEVRCGGRGNRGGSCSHWADQTWCYQDLPMSWCHEQDMVETVTADKRQAVERTESGTVTEFLQVPQDSLQTCIFRAEWNSALSRMGRAWGFQMIPFEFETLFCTTSWWIGTQLLHTWIMVKFTPTSKLWNLISSRFTMYSKVVWKCPSSPLLH